MFIKKITYNYPDNANDKHDMNLFLRSLLLNSCLVLITPVFAIMSVFCWLLSDNMAYTLIIQWSKLVIWLAKIICHIEYTVIGLENLPTQNAIVLCKHQSVWETLFMQCLLPQQTWVLKRELLWIPFFGWGLARLKPIAIRRNKIHSINDLLTQGKAALHQGKWVIIFPEGTRVKIGETKKYSRSGAALAESSGYPVVLIAHNAGICWPKNRFLKYPGKITVVISSPLFKNSYQNSQELHKLSRDWIEKTSQQLTEKSMASI